MTADVMAGAEQECLDAGMNDYVSKPVRPEVLFHKLARLAKTIEDNLPRTQSFPANLEGIAPAAWSSLTLAEDVRTLDLHRLQELQSTLRVGAVRDLLLLYMLDTDNHLAVIRKQRASGRRMSKPPNSASAVIATPRPTNTGSGGRRPATSDRNANSPMARPTTITASWVSGDGAQSAAWL